MPNWRLGLSHEVWTSLVTASCSPDQGNNEFLFATCVRLVDRHGNPERGGNFVWEMDAFSDLYRKAPKQIRAAIFNGLRTGTECQEDCLTNSTGEVIAKLIALARRLTAEERTEISAGDYGCDIGKHRAALDALLETEDCRFADTWFPAEVVELTAHVPDAPGFVGCTALVLANAIYDGDKVDHAAFRWHQHRHAYHRLASVQAQLLLRAFRILYEAIPDWDPFWDVVTPDRMSLDHFIPWQPPDPNGGL